MSEAPSSSKPITAAVLWFNKLSSEEPEAAACHGCNLDKRKPLRTSQGEDA